MRNLLRSLTRLDWRYVATELVIVVFGILIALQVNSWWESARQRSDEARFSEQLLYDMRANIHATETLITQVEAQLADVRHVFGSLSAGAVLDGDEVSFERGLLYADVLPALPRVSATYQQLIDTGFFASLSSEDVKGALAELDGLQQRSDQQLGYYRQGLTELRQRLAGLIDVYFDPEHPLPSSARPEAVALAGARARYEFERLATDRVLRNLYFEAIDSYEDWLEDTRLMLDRARLIETLLAPAVGK